MHRLNWNLERSMIATIAAISWAPAYADLSDCTCDDIPLVKMRRATANVAMETYFKLVESYERNGRVAGKPVMYSTSEAAAADSEVQEAINNRRALKDTFKPTAPTEQGVGSGKSTPLISSGDTNGGNCAATIRHNNACIKSILAIHEAVHQQACRDYFSGFKLHAPWSVVEGANADYKTSQSMVDQMKEQIRAYQAELHAIEGNSKNFQNCRKLKVEHSGKVNWVDCQVDATVSLRFGESGEMACPETGGGCEAVGKYVCHGARRDKIMDALGTVRYRLSGTANGGSLNLTISPVMGETGTATACSPKGCVNAPFLWGLFPPEDFSIADKDGSESSTQSKFGDYHYLLQKPWK